LSNRELNSIPKHLHETAANMRADLWDEISLMPDRQRNALIEAEHERQELRAQYQQVFYERAQLVDHWIEIEGQRTVQTLNTQYENEDRASLQSWVPFGSDMEANERIREAALSWTLADMGKNKVNEGWRQEALKLIPQVLNLRAAGYDREADQAEQQM